MSRLIATAKILLVAAVAFAAAAGSGCSSARRYDPTPEGEFEQAFDQYEEENYATAIEMFKDLIYKYPGSALVEQARYYLADSYFRNEDWVLASNEFELLNREFPQGRYADLALFKAGLAYAAMSRRPERDQSETQKALDTFQTMLTRYPTTEYADTVNVHIDKLKSKLARKELLNAEFYYEREEYDAAIIYLKSLLANYPEAEVTPQALYMLYHSSRRMGYPDDADDALKWLCQDFPESSQASELCGRQQGGEDQSLTGEPGAAAVPGGGSGGTN